MEAKTYTLCLIGDDVRDEFLAEIGDRYEVVHVYNNIPSLLKIRLTQSEREELLNNIYVLGIDQIKMPEPLMPTIRSGAPGEKFEFSNEKTITVKNPSYTEPGSNYISAIHKYFTNGVTTTNPNGLRNVGLKGDFFQPSMVGCNYNSFLTGENIDIVAWEAYDSKAPNSYHRTHPDYFHPGQSGNSRMVEMNWSNYGSYIRDPMNINQSSYLLTNHGAGVLSCAGGIYGGLAKKASLRQITMQAEDSITDCADAIVAWHNSKPVNSTTGKKNPTIVTAAFGGGSPHSVGIRIREIASFTIRGTTTNRPPSDRNPELNGWKLSDFVDNNMLPLLLAVGGDLDDPLSHYEWCITIDDSGQSDASTTSIRNAAKSLTDAGIHFIPSAGNSCNVYAKYDSADWDNKITTDSTYDFFRAPYNSPQQAVSMTGSDDYFVHRFGSIQQAEESILVGARQRSEETPAIDPYSSRGPAIDIFGLGFGTWSSHPVVQFSDGNRWNTFSGTSAAGPTVAGVAACILEYQYLTTGSYPNPATLKNLLLGVADSTAVRNYETTDWDSSTIIAQDYYRAAAAAEPYDDAAALVIPPGVSFFNGNPVATDLLGSTTRGAFLPDAYRTYNPQTGEFRTNEPEPLSPSGPCIHPTIKGPTGSVSSPPYNYAQSYDKWEGSRGSPGGIYFQPSGEESNYPPENISYVNFRLRMRSFGPRGGNGETIYLTSNRGNRDPNKGRVRKWYTEHQSVVDNDPEKWTTNRGDAFVPFRIHFRVGFVAGGDGAYRILYSNHYHDWSNFEYKDIDFDSSEMARQNNLPTDGSGKIIFPDFGTKNYTQPRIYEIKADIYNLDLNPNEGEAKNRINMFAQATNDSNKAKESQVLEFGKYIIQ